MAGGGPDDLARPQYCHRLELRPHFFWMTARRRRNLEMPGNVTALGQMSGIDKVRKIVGKILSEKNCLLLAQSSRLHER